ncbi:MAG: HAD-IA family hydrolase [Gaiellaceae bacterium]
MIADSQDAGAFTAYPDALRFIIAIKRRRDPCRRGLLLQQCGPLPAPDPPGHRRGRERSGVRPGDAGAHPPGVFDADISGRDFAQGKPHPELFLTGCKELSVPPEECFGVTDAVSGIQAAEAGGMAALGLSRAHDEELLAAADPDVLVTSLDHVDLDALAEGRWLRGGT